jgi:hypothetical protein
MAVTWVSVLSEINPQPNPSGGTQTNATAWGVPGEDVMALDVQNDKCAMLLAQLKDPETATKVARSKCKAAFAAHEGLMRALHAYFYVKWFPKEELSRLGLLDRDKNRTPTPTPKSVAVVVDVVAKRGHLVVFHFRDEHSEKSEKIPDNYDGAVLNFACGPEKILDATLIKERRLMTASPYTLTGLPPSAEGQWLSFYLQWQTHGEEGPPGEVFHVMIT